MYVSEHCQRIVEDIRTNFKHIFDGRNEENYCDGVWHLKVMGRTFGKGASAGENDSVSIQETICDCANWNYKGKGNE